jgi:hypothetical protein
MIVIHFWIPTWGLAISFSCNLCLVAQFSGCHLQVGRGIVLFAAGFGQSVSRGSQGVGDSLLIPERDKERPRGEGSGVSLLTIDGRSSGKRLAKSTLLLATFSFREKVGE